MRNINEVVYFANEDGKIESMPFGELAQQFVDITTTPRGVAPRMHKREEIVYDFAGDSYDKLFDAEDVRDQDHDGVGEIIERAVFEIWTWGHAGNFPERLDRFDTESEADEKLDEFAEYDFYHASNSPQIFATEAEAQAALVENSDD